MKYFSMFSGIGGFELGIQYAYNKLQQETTEERLQDERRDRDIDSQQDSTLSTKITSLCVGYSEIDKYAIQIYEKQFRGHKNYGDATKIKPEELPDFDLLVGGFPCQAFSIAGNRRGFEDTRGTMFFEIARIIKGKQPRMFLLENVKGLLNHDKGNTFTKILQTIDELGYDAEWQVLNSKHFGVPQNRERVFIIGHFRGTSRRQIFPLRHSNRILNQGRQERKTQDQFATTLTQNLKRGVHSGGETLIEVTQGMSDAQRVYDISGISKTIKGLGGGQGAKTGLYVIPVLTPDRPIKRQNGRRFKEDGDPSFTLTSQDRHGIYNDNKIRRLTPTECERLQGFPDGWTAGFSDTQRYKCLGNAVTVNVIERIIQCLNKD